MAEEIVHLSSIEKTNDQREINFCFGTLSVYGIITARSCCEVDQLFVVNQTKSEELPIDFNAVWIDNDICLINKTENMNMDVQHPITNMKDCAISIFDRIANDFIDIEFDDRNITCLNEICFYSTNVNDDWILLDGTAIVCDHFKIYGILMRSKFFNLRS